MVMISSPLVGKTAQTGFQRIAGTILGNPAHYCWELADALRQGSLGRQGGYRYRAAGWAEVRHWYGGEISSEQGTEAA